MIHRELYRTLVPDNAYIITFSDLASCGTCAAARRVAKEIYYSIPNSYSSDAQKDGTTAHKIKEMDIDPSWQNEMRLSYKMSDNYYLCGTIDRFYILDKIIEDYKCTTSEAISYTPTNQIETYAFLLMQNGGLVNEGKYTTIDKNGSIISTHQFNLPVDKILFAYSSFILPRFNMIKKELEELKNNYVGINRTAKSIFD